MAVLKVLESPVNPGDHLDHYRIDRVVARSSEATIFHATDLRNGSEVAIKVPHSEMESDPTFADRFTRDLEIGERLDHPGLVKVIADPDRTKIYMMMESFAGKTL
jgi:serine/threonine-protein kinase